MRALVEYVAYRLLALVVPLLPRAAMVWFARRLGGAYVMASGRTRTIGMANLRRFLPERDDHRRILRESVRLQAVALLDTLWSARLGPQAARRFLDIPAGQEGRILDLLARGRGLLFGTAHFGSWEMLNLAGGNRGLPPATFIARPVRNALVDRHLRRARERTGNRLVYRHRALGRCIGALRRGEIVCSVIDMSVVPTEGGVFVDFFGMPALTSGALPLLARKFRAPLVFAVCIPLDKGLRYRVEVEEIAVDHEAERDAGILRVLGAMNRALERHIRARPEAWIWGYKRWKSRASEIPGNYPSYSLWVHPHW